MNLSLCHTHKQPHRVEITRVPCWGCWLPLLSAPLWTRQRLSHRLSGRFFPALGRFFPRVSVRLQLAATHPRVLFLRSIRSIAQWASPSPSVSQFAVALALSQCCLPVPLVILSIHDSWKWDINWTESEVKITPHQAGLFRWLLWSRSTVEYPALLRNHVKLFDVSWHFYSKGQQGECQKGPDRKFWSWQVNQAMTWFLPTIST